MKKIAGLLLIVTFAVGACGSVPPDTIGLPAGMSNVPSPTPVIETDQPAHTALPLKTTWQIQYSGEMDYSLDVGVYNLDLFDTDADVIAQLHGRGIFVMCYFSAGSFEDWRSDAKQFPAEILGKEMKGWQGEKWLDIRKKDLLAPVMFARLDLAAQKDCDGVDPDNVNGYTNDTGFPLLPNDQIAYNTWLADEAHTHGLSIGLKNDLDQIPDLLPFFDWVLNEECFSYGECQLLLPFIQAGKPVFVIEYDMKPEEFCPKANELNFNAMQKKWELDGFYFSCR
jgi:hypothetical protein